MLDRLTGHLQDGDMDSRWSCGPLATGSIQFNTESCDLDFSLNYYRYIRQIQFGECKTPAILFSTPPLSGFGCSTN